MIQRRGVGLDPPTPSVPDASESQRKGPSHVSGNATSHKRKRRVRPGSKTRGNRWIRGICRIAGDIDSIVTIIQVSSIIIIVYCAIVLCLYFFTGDIHLGDDDTALHSFRNAFLVRMNSWFLGRDLRFVHPLHADHANAGIPNREVYTRSGKELPDLEPSSIYTIPGSMPHIGDKSDDYARLRKEYDAMDLPEVKQRYQFKTMPMVADTERHAGQPNHLPDAYDIHDCPERPPPGYPYQWNLLQILDHWNPDDHIVPDDLAIFQGLCVFDFHKDYQKALNYRNREVPFIVKNDPAVQQTAKRWMAPGYMERLMGNVKHRTEYSETNHFMYWNAGATMRKKQHIPPTRGGRNPFMGDGHPDGRGIEMNLAKWQQPTQMMRMSYAEWLAHANLTEGEAVGPNDPHWYYRLIGCGEQSPLGHCDKGSSEYLFDELTFFQPKKNLYMVEPDEQKGIHCRFGMTGVIAENHFDMSRNAIAVMGGERRYILADPGQCSFMSLLPKGHPSARHSAVDWSDPDLQSYPEFAHAEGNEVVLQAGDVLYLPTHWFHYIISLNLNFQCNSRSGLTRDYADIMHHCGF